MQDLVHLPGQYQKMLRNAFLLPLIMQVYTHLLQKNNDEMLGIIEKSSQNLLDKNKKP